MHIMTNNGREYVLSNLPGQIDDIDMLDKIMKGIAIDTGRSRNAYNRINFRVLPRNLWPDVVYKHEPQLGNKKVGSSFNLRRVLNRQIFREVDQDNQKSNEIDSKLEAIGVKPQPDDDRFYKTLKITKEDFISVGKSV